MTFSVHPIDILHVNDNYVWAITPHNSNKAYVVDPGEAAAVLEWLDQQQRELAGILITHRHWDHVNGIDGLVERFPVPVWGPALANLPQISHTLAGGDTLNLDNVEFRVMAVPGHTRDHIAYISVADSLAKPALFCGDTLFAAGCGRVFDGSHAELHQALRKFVQLPLDTVIYCAHEYTLANLEFAAAVEPGNQAIAQRRQEVEHLRRQNLPSLPTELRLELATNPFLRWDQREVINNASRAAGCELTDSTEVFAALRRWKDTFQC